MTDVRATFNYDADFSSALSQVKALSKELGVLNTSFNVLDKNARDVRNLTSNVFKGALGDIGNFNAATVDLTTDLEKFGKQLDRGKLKLRDYYREARKAFNENSNARKLAEDQVRRTRSQLVELGMDPSGRRKGILVTPMTIDTREMQNKLDISKKQFEIFNKLVQDGATKLIDWGKNTQWAGRQLTVGLTVPMTIFASTTIKAFNDVDKELTRFQKVYGSDLVNAVGSSTTAIRGQVQALAVELAKTYGIAAKETAGLAADLAATGLEGQKLIDSVKQTTRLAVLGEVDRQEAMKTTLSLQNAFNMSTQELAESIDFLNAVENQTSVSLQDMTEAIPRVGPVMRAMGGDVKDLSVLLVAMKEGGINAAEGANALKSGLASIINPTKQASAVAKQYGIDLESIVNKNKGKLMPTVLEFQAMLSKLDDLSKAKLIEQLFGKYQFARISALFDNLNASGSQTAQVLELMGASSRDLAKIANKEIKTLTESTSMRWQRATEAIKASLLPLGEALASSLLPILEKMSSFIDTMVKFGKSLPEPVKNLLKFTAGITAIAGPLIMITGVLGNFLGYLVKGSMAFVNLGRRMQGLPTKQFELLDDHQIAAAKATDILTTSIERQKASMASLNRLMQDYALTLTNIRMNEPNLFSRSASVTTTRTGMPIVPANARSLPIVKRQKGSWVPGSGSGDTVPALLEPGEFVVNRKAAKKYGGELEAINSGVPRFGSKKLQSGGPMTDEDRAAYMEFFGNYKSYINEHGQRVDYSNISKRPPFIGPLPDVYYQVDARNPMYGDMGYPFSTKSQAEWYRNQFDPNSRGSSNERIRRKFADEQQRVMSTWIDSSSMVRNSQTDSYILRGLMSRIEDEKMLRRAVVLNNRSSVQFRGGMGSILLNAIRSGNFTDLVGQRVAWNGIQSFSDQQSTASMFNKYISGNTTTKALNDMTDVPVFFEMSSKGKTGLNISDRAKSQTVMGQGVSESEYVLNKPAGRIESISQDIKSRGYVIRLRRQLGGGIPNVEEIGTEELLKKARAGHSAPAVLSKEKQKMPIWDTLKLEHDIIEKYFSDLGLSQSQRDDMRSIDISHVGQFDKIIRKVGDIEVAFKVWEAQRLQTDLGVINRAIEFGKTDIEKLARTNKSFASLLDKNGEVLHPQNTEEAKLLATALDYLYGTSSSKTGKGLYGRVARDILNSRVENPRYYDTLAERSFTSQGTYYTANKEVLASARSASRSQPNAESQKTVSGLRQSEAKEIVGRHGVGAFGRIRRQKGGSAWVPGNGNGDRVPAMLEPGEFVVNKKAAAKHRESLNHINFIDAPRFAEGGPLTLGDDGKWRRPNGQFANKQEIESFKASINQRSRSTGMAAGGISSLAMTAAFTAQSMQDPNKPMSDFMQKLIQATNMISLFTGAVSAAQMVMASSTKAGAAANVAGSVGGDGKAGRLGKFAKMGKLAGAGARIAAMATNPFTLAVSGLALVTYAVTKYKKSIEDASKSGKAAFESQTKAAEILGIQLKSVGDNVNALRSSLDKFSAGPAPTPFLSKEQQDQIAGSEPNIKLIEQLKTSQNAQGILLSQYSKMLLQGMMPQEAMAIIKLLAERSGREDALLNAREGIKGLNQAGTPQEQFDLAIKNFTNVLSSTISQTVSNNAQTSSSGIEFAGMTGRATGLANVQTSSDITATQQAKITGAFSGALEGIALAPDLASQIQGFKELNAALKNMPDVAKTAAGKSLKGFVTETLGKEAGSNFVKAFDNLKDVEEQSILVNAEMAGVSLEGFIEDGKVTKEELAEIENQLGKISKAAQIDLNIKTTTANALAKIEKQMGDVQSTFDSALLANERNVDAENARYENAQKAHEKFINAKEKEINEINKGTDAYLKSLQKENAAEKFYQKQADTALGGLGALAGGDVFGFIASQQQMAADAQDYAFETEISRIEEKRDAEVNSLQEQIEKRQELAATEDERHAARLKNLENERIAASKIYSDAMEALGKQQKAIQDMSTGGPNFENMVNGYSEVADEAAKATAMQIAINYLSRGESEANAIKAGEAYLKSFAKNNGGFKKETRRESYANGGYISGAGGPTSDLIPARLSNGEYVVRASAVDQYGVGMMDAINNQKFADGGFVSPTRSGKKAGNPYGIKKSYYSLGYHTGQDYSAAVGADILSVADGNIIRAGEAGAYGKQIVIQHLDGIRTYYSHLSKILRDSGSVKKGQHIGAAGFTGNVLPKGPAGAHLHFEARKSPYGFSNDSIINPNSYLAGAASIGGENKPVDESGKVTLESLDKIAAAMGTTAEVFADIKENGIMSQYPGRKFGGSTIMNKPYVVGENGPEVFLPYGSGGRVAPIKYSMPKMASGGIIDGTVNNAPAINISVNGVNDPSQAADRVMQLLNQQMRRKDFGGSFA